MQENPAKEEEPEYLPPDPRQKIIIALMLAGLCVLLIYAIIERHSIKELAASRDELTAALNQERAEVQTLTQKLLSANSAATPAAPTPAAASTAVTAPEPQPAASPTNQEEAPTAAPTSVSHQTKKHTAAVKAHRAVDPWRKQIQSQLSEQQKLLAAHQREIQETKDSVDKTRTDLEGNLESTRNDLNGAIAKNHDELVALERKGERNYFEFSLQKSKQFHKEGPLSISLRKSDPKHEYCDLVMIVNDSEVSKKHVNLYEPVLFYPEGYSQPLQVVINNLGKDAARGYVSEPKYKPPELATGASSSGGATQAPAEGATLKHRPDTAQ